MQFSIFYIGGLILILVGVILYNLILPPQGDANESVFSIKYWYKYGHSLFCEWRCCPLQNKSNELTDNTSVGNHKDRKALIDSDFVNGTADCSDDQSMTEYVETLTLTASNGVNQPVHNEVDTEETL